MHARHRSPGNGYRPNSMGMGFGGSRISPDNSGRGHGFYDSEYRNFNNNRGFGRPMGHQPKSFQQPPQPPPPRKGDILMEAGRLAAEYLVSKGLLPQNALSGGKWLNGNSKKQVVGENQDFRVQDEANQDGQTPTHSRFGSGASDAGVGRRRYMDDFNSRNQKGRRRGEYLNWNYGTEGGGREFGRTELWADRNRMSPGMEGESDTVSGQCDEQQVGDDTSEGMQKSGLSGSVPECGEVADTESFSEHNNSDEMGSKASSSNSGKEEVTGEPCKPQEDSTILNSRNEEVEDSNEKHETDKQVAQEDIIVQQSSVDGDRLGKNVSDLLTVSNFAEIPTRTRSAVTDKVPKIDQVPNTEEGNASDEPLEGSEATVQDNTLDFATADNLPNTNVSNCHDSEIPETPSVKTTEDAGQSSPVIVAGQVKCMRSQSFPERAIIHDNEQQSCQGVLGFGRSTSVKDRGEKRAVEDSDVNEASKKPREWFASLVNTGSDRLHPSSTCQNQESSPDRPSDQLVTIDVTQGSLVNSHQFANTGAEPCNEYSQEKQLFPSSFKICDLNLMEASDINYSNCHDAILMHPSMALCKKEPVDIDLSISNANLSDEYPRYSSNGKNIEVIDLENDSISEEKDFDDISQRKDTAFSGPEGIPNRAQNVGDISDVNDSYDGMISEYLTTFSNNSVTEDISPLQNEMGLHNGEGTLGDDDSIYMSLGEIPLSFIPAWEQPSQKYGKPF